MDLPRGTIQAVDNQDLCFRPGALLRASLGIHELQTLHCMDQTIQAKLDQASCIQTLARNSNVHLKEDLALIEPYSLSRSPKPYPQRGRLSKNSCFFCHVQLSQGEVA